MTEATCKMGEIEGCCSELLVAEPEVAEWEYNIASFPALGVADSKWLVVRLNIYGLDRWELVQLFPLDSARWHRAIFKRRCRTEPDQDKCCECGR